VLLVDTNVWLAAADRRSDRHSDFVALLSALIGELASPVPVIAETSWLILDRLGPAAHQQFLGLVQAGHLEAVNPSTEPATVPTETCALTSWSGSHFDR